MANELFDALRLLTVAIGFIDLGLTLAVFHLYLHAKRLNDIDRNQALGRFVGALPRHILSVSAAHALMILAISGVIIGRIGHPFMLWPTPIALLAFGLSLFGQYEMLRFQSRRIDLAQGSIMITGSR